VITATHGTDHVSVDYLKKKGIAFHDVPVQSYDVAQGVIAYILAYATNLLNGDRSTKRGEWRKKKLIGVRIRDKTLGIVGYGRIGREVARMASALEMKVTVYDPHVKPVEDHVDTLEALLEVADFITVHTPLTETTRGLIGPREIARMKDGVYLINTARGGIIDEKAVLAAVRSGKLRGVALDVYAHQSPFHDETSWGLIQEPKVIATPHSIGQTQEAVIEKGVGVINIIKDHITQKDGSPKC
jgi:D-3-phosphoglycerate dehydrogenase